jgi:glutamate-1-semialdehyde aminotransferase
LTQPRNLATSDTLFGNPLSAAAAQAALTQVLVPNAYAHTSTLGAALADGIEEALPGAARRYRSGDPLRRVPLPGRFTPRAPHHPDPMTAARRGHRTTGRLVR